MCARYSQLTGPFANWARVHVHKKLVALINLIKTPQRTLLSIKRQSTSAIAANLKGIVAFGQVSIAKSGSNRDD